MYFIKYHLLKKNLRNRSLTVRDSLPYLIAIIIVSSLPGPVGRHNLWDSISEILSAVAFVGGVLYAYYKNGGAAGNDFFLKYILIGWVAFVRLLLVFTPACFILVYLGAKTGLMSLETGPYDMILGVLPQIILHQRIGRHIKDTRSNNIEQDAHEL